MHQGYFHYAIIKVNLKKQSYIGINSIETTNKINETIILDLASTSIFTSNITVLCCEVLADPRSKGSASRRRGKERGKKGRGTRKGMECNPAVGVSPDASSALNERL